jgi:cytochrome d ubiquinol oxidase subunit I
VHFFSTLMVFLGSMFSAIWIVVANSWQQTPSGFHIVGSGMQARAEITDFWAMVFNPSSVERLIHVWIAAFLAGIFLVLSVNAWYILKNKHLDIAKRSFKIALVAATVFSLLQLVAGHQSAEVVSKHQPAKLATLEGHYDSMAVADMFLFGYVDNKTQKVTGIKIPGGLSFLTHGDFNTPVKGLNAFKPEERPTQVNTIFQFYHIMVAIGMFMIGLTVYASWLSFKNKLFEKRWLMWVFVWAVLGPQIANQTGWFAAEMGRQPWVVYGLLRTSDALSKTVTANQVVFSLVMFTVVYTLLLVLFLYLLNKKIQHGPVDYGTKEDIEAGSKRDNPILIH